MSIKSNELRIGNLLKYGGIDTKITHLDIRYLAIKESLKKDTSIYKPIPLTEEWLLNFGFGIDEEYDNTFIHNTSLKNEIIRVSIDSHYFTIELFGNQVLEIPNIKYVHQLQNLYFALTFEELTIKL